MGSNRAAIVAGVLLLFLDCSRPVWPDIQPIRVRCPRLAAFGWRRSLTVDSHWLGTDRLGRDLFVRTLYGVRVSLLIGVVSTAISLGIGVLWGAIAGYLGGRTDELMMRFVDVLYSLPYLFIVIILMTVFQRGSLWVLFCAIGAVGWLTTARIVRGQTLALKQREFVEAAARAAGLGSAGNLLLRHIIPNLMGAGRRLRDPHACRR